MFPRVAVSQDVVESYWVAHPGQRVMTCDGFPGRVTAVELGPQGGNESYLVVLDNDLGGGAYRSSDITPLTTRTSADNRLASDDYPELADILVQRPPLTGEVSDTGAYGDGLADAMAGRPLSLPSNPRDFDGYWSGFHAALASVTENTPVQHEAGVSDWLYRNTSPANRLDADTLPSHDWCRFRRDSHCFFPKTLNESATRGAGYAVWNPADRGWCPRIAWAEQQACPVAEPGPNVPGGYTDATVPYNQGGQHSGSPGTPWRTTHPMPGDWKAASAKLPFEFVASWKDVRAKAKRIASTGRVRIISAPRQNTVTVVAEVQGDTDLYQTSISRVPGTYAIGQWTCGCAWASYSWGRSGPYKKYESRMCSHALATMYEAQRREMFGREIVEDRFAPSWRDPSVVPKTMYDKDKRRSVAALDPPVAAWASGELCAGADPNDVLAALVDMGVPRAPEIMAVAFTGVIPAQVGGQPIEVEVTADGVLLGDQPIPGEQVFYPSWDPARGLRLTDASVTGDGDQAGPEATLHDEPEPALPETDGIEVAALGGLDAFVQSTAASRAWIGQGADSGNAEIAAAARQALAARDLTPAEKQALIEEGADVEAANLSRLDISGTHYLFLEEALASDDMLRAIEDVA